MLRNPTFCDFSVCLGGRRVPPAPSESAHADPDEMPRSTIFFNGLDFSEAQSLSK